MSKLGKNKINEKNIRLDIFFMKLKVTVVLLIFKKFEVRREEKEVNDIVERELKEWSSSKGYKISIRKEQIPQYIRGHSVYQLHNMRHCKIISFSR